MRSTPWETLLWIVGEEAAGLFFVKCDKLARITEELGRINGMKKKIEELAISQEKQRWFAE